MLLPTSSPNIGLHLKSDRGKYLLIATLLPPPENVTVLQ